MKNGSWEEFNRLVSAVPGCDILEVGTKRSMRGRPTHSKLEFPQANRYVMSDFQMGEDVDVVADIQRLSDVFDENEFDFFLSNSTFEHVARPWLAAEEIWKILKPGGCCFVQTHQSFPIHGYPQDFWRFTTEALQVIFHSGKWETLKANYTFPCTIQKPPEVTNWNPAAPAFLNVNILTRRRN